MSDIRVKKKSKFVSKWVGKTENPLIYISDYFPSLSFVELKKYKIVTANRVTMKYSFSFPVITQIRKFSSIRFGYQGSYSLFISTCP